MYQSDPQVMRIIDANLNRAGEGLRFLEELARMVLNDPELTAGLKTLRHKLVINDTSFNRQLLGSRNASGDVGIDIEVDGEEKGKGIAELLVANSRRAQESLRILEELAKIPGISDYLDSNKFKHARFELYTVEKQLMSRLQE